MDMNRLPPSNRRTSADRLRREQGLLDEWSEKRIAKR
jgi:hypothetical protein